MAHCPWTFWDGESAVDANALVNGGHVAVFYVNAGSINLRYETSITDVLSVAQSSSGKKQVLQRNDASTVMVLAPRLRFSKESESIGVTWMNAIASSKTKKPRGKTKKFIREKLVKIDEDAFVDFINKLLDDGNLVHSEILYVSPSCKQKISLQTDIASLTLSDTSSPSEKHSS